jgi:hypothetical protein
MRKTFDDYKNLLVHALSTSNWNDLAIYSTELLKINDKISWIWSKRGIALAQLGHPFDAILSYDRSLALEETVEALSNKAAALREIDNDAEALIYFNKALALDPNVEQVHMNLGHLYKWNREDKKALDAYLASVAANPNYADGHMALGIMLLKMGKLKDGWEHYEWRWKSDQLPPRGLRVAQWEGEDLNGKSILIYAEQGLGDIIQFCRYARTLKQIFPKATIHIEGRQAVKNLLKSIHAVDSVINVGDKVPVVDYAIPMVTLAGMLTPTIESIPSPEGLFNLANIDVVNWKNKLEQLPSGFRVGVCWAGMARTAHPMALRIDKMRSASLDTFAPLAQIKDIVWVSLQKGPPSSQVQKPPAGMTIGDFTEDMYDFYETCCAIQACDLVITVDTAVAHAAASVGKPTWVLSRWDGCWRWFGTRMDSPWYPSVKQFVQPAPHDWENLMKEVALELQKLVPHEPT